MYDTIKDEWIVSNDNSNNLISLPFSGGGMGNAIFYENKIYIFGGETYTNPNGFANKTTHIIL